LAIGEFQIYVERQGGAAEILHGGPDKTKEIEIEIWFEDENTTDKDGYAIRLSCEHNRLLITEEAVLYETNGQTKPVREVISKYPHTESVLKSWAITNKNKKCYVYKDFVSSYNLHNLIDELVKEIKKTNDDNTYDIILDKIVQTDSVIKYLVSFLDKVDKEYKEAREAISTSEADIKKTILGIIEKL